MSVELRQTWLWAIACLTLLTGVVLSASTWSNYTKTDRRIDLLLGYIDTLVLMQQPAQAQQSALDLITQLPQPNLVSLENLAAISGAAKHATIRQTHLTPLPDGWQARTIEVSATNISHTILSNFLQQAESQRPPWRLVKCDLRGSDQQSQSASATLTFEGLEKP